MIRFFVYSNDFEGARLCRDGRRPIRHRSGGAVLPRVGDPRERGGQGREHRHVPAGAGRNAHQNRGYREGRPAGVWAFVCGVRCV